MADWIARRGRIADPIDFFGVPPRGFDICVPSLTLSALETLYPCTKDDDDALPALSVLAVQVERTVHRFVDLYRLECTIWQRRLPSDLPSHVSPWCSPPHCRAFAGLCAVIGRHLRACAPRWPRLHRGTGLPSGGGGAGRVAVVDSRLGGLDGLVGGGVQLCLLDQLEHLPNGVEAVCVPEKGGLKRPTAANDEGDADANSVVVEEQLAGKEDTAAVALLKRTAELVRERSVAWRLARAHGVDAAAVGAQIERTERLLQLAGLGDDDVASLDTVIDGLDSRLLAWADAGAADSTASDDGASAGALFERQCRPVRPSPVETAAVDRLMRDVGLMGADESQAPGGNDRNTRGGSGSGGGGGSGSGAKRSGNKGGGKAAVKAAEPEPEPEPESESESESSEDDWEAAVDALNSGGNKGNKGAKKQKQKQKQTQKQQQQQKKKQEEEEEKPDLEWDDSDEDDDSKPTASNGGGGGDGDGKGDDDEAAALLPFSDNRHWHSGDLLTDPSAGREEKTVDRRSKRAGRSVARMATHMGRLADSLGAVDRQSFPQVVRDKSSMSKREKRQHQDEERALKSKRRAEADRQPEREAAHRVALQQRIEALNKTQSNAAEQWRLLKEIAAWDVHEENSVEPAVRAEALRLCVDRGMDTLSKRAPEPAHVAQLMVWLLELVGGRIGVGKKGGATPAEDMQRFERLREAAKVVSRADWVAYQLCHLSDRLVRPKAPRDERLPFRPDPWQVELTDAIDQEASVLAVAPTSSGKSFASLYAIHRVLSDRKDRDGCVVFVVPTKSLVNQVAAQVLGRFSKVPMQAGVSLWGMFTADYSHNTENCRVLVTVPQCLSILLEGNRSAWWSQRIRYTIFDEVHSLMERDNGKVWERVLHLTASPFLAMSATVGNMEGLASWMKDITKRHAPKRPFIAVHHTERWNPLRMYAWPAVDEPLHPLDLVRSGTDLLAKDAAGRDLLSTLPMEARDLWRLWDELRRASSEVESPSKLLAEVLAQADAEKWMAAHGGIDGAGKDSEWPCVTVKNVLEWGTMLRGHVRSLLESADEADRGVVQRVLDRLTPAADVEGVDADAVVDAESKVSSPLIANVVPVVQELQKRGRLPALMVAFDRNTVEEAAEALTAFQRQRESDAMKEGANAERLAAAERDDAEYKARLDKAKTDKALAKERRELDTEGKTGRRRKDLEHRLGAPFTWTEGRRAEAESCDEVLHMRGTHPDDWKRKPDELDLKIADMLSRGVGMHHAGMRRAHRRAVEIMFRRGLLSVCCCTTTLTVGIHMPIRTVVMLGDSGYLTPMAHAQAAGRAGRRGMDTVGHVLHVGIPEGKLRHLLTAPLPDVRTSFGLDTSSVYRLLVMRIMAEKEGGRAAVQHANRSLCAVVSNALQSSTVRRAHFRLAIDVLCALRVLGPDLNSVHGAGGLVTHLHWCDPGNVVLVHLVQSGVLTALCDGAEGATSLLEASRLGTEVTWGDAFRPLGVVLTRLLARQRWSRVAGGSAKAESERKTVSPMPAAVQGAVDEFGSYVMDALWRLCDWMRANEPGAAERDCVLPLSERQFGQWQHGGVGGGEVESITSPFVLLASGGHHDPLIEACGAGRSDVQTVLRMVCQSAVFDPATVPVWRGIDNACSATGGDGKDAVPLRPFVDEFFQNGDMRATSASCEMRDSDLWFALDRFVRNVKAIDVALRQSLTPAGVDDLVEGTESNDALCEVMARLSEWTTDMFRGLDKRHRRR